MSNQLLRNYGFLFKNLWKVNWQLTYGVWKISHLPEPRVTIFGGTRVPANSYFAKQAHTLSHRLAQAGISVITGGGPGIMQAATCGITHEEINEVKARTLGITVQGLDIGFQKDQCTEEYIVMDHFFSRKWLMMNFSIAFAVFPGGIGTLDELVEAAMLLQVKQLHGIPLILVSKDYWQPLLQWLTQFAFTQGLMSEEDIKLMRITDDVDEAFYWLQERCELYHQAQSAGKKR